MYFGHDKGGIAFLEASIMGLWSRIVKAFSGKQPEKKSSTQILSFNMLGGSDESKTLNATFMAAVHKYADTISKLRPEFQYKGERYQSKLDQKLRLMPNPAMNASLFYKTIATSYYEENVAVVWIQYKGGKVVALWPIDVTDGSFTCVQSGSDVAFEFTLEGRTYHSTMDDTIVLVRQPSTENPFVTHDESLRYIVNVLNKNYQGLALSLANANVAKFIATASAPLPPATIKQRQKQLEDMLNDMGSNGVAYVDGSNSLTPVNANNYRWQSSDDIAELKKEIFQYMNINAAVLDGSANDEQMHTWIEQSIEPFTLALECELNRVLLTERERDVGNVVICPTDSLYSASFTHRERQATTLIQSGVFKPNEIRRLLGIQTLDGPEGEQVVNRIDRIDTSNQEEEKEPQENGIENEQ